MFIVKLESYAFNRCLMAVKCGQRSLTLISLGFGLVATGTLALAVATDYWLWTSDPIIKELTMDSVKHYEGPALENPAPPHDFPPEGTLDNSYEGTLDSSYEMDYNMSDYGSMGLGYDGIPMQIEITIMAHSGLWRMCIFYEGSDAPDCRIIDYLKQEWERIEDANTTWSILRAIRKASPVIVFALLLLIIAFSLSTLGNTKRDFRTITGAMIYVFAALFLAVGVILYISAVNDEMAHRKKPNADGKVFEYHYGWAFFFAGSSFITSLMASVTNISLYLKRFPTIEDMANIIPGLEKKHNYNFSKVSSDDDLDITVCSQNPTLIL